MRRRDFRGYIFSTAVVHADVPYFIIIFRPFCDDVNVHATVKYGHNKQLRATTSPLLIRIIVPVYIL